MGVVDIALGIFILVLAVRGFIRGLIREIFGLAALIVGIIFSNAFGKTVGHYIATHISISSVAAYAAGFFITFLSSYVLLLFVGYVISSILKKVELGWLDRMLGFVFGVLKASFMIAVVVFVLESFPFLKGFDYELNRSSLVYSIIRNDFVNKTDVMKLINDLRHKKIARGYSGPIFIEEGGNAQG